MNETDLKVVLEILHNDKVIDCNQYQGKDFDFLLKRFNIITCLRKTNILFGTPKWVKSYKEIAKQMNWKY